MYNCCSVYNPPSGAGSSAVTGSGTLNYIAKWTPSGSAIGNSQMFDNGTNIGINKFSSFVANTFITIKDPGTLFEDATIYITDFADNLMFVFNNSGKFGIGTDITPDAYLHVVGTTEQMRIAYSATQYYTTTVSSVGLVQFNATGTTVGFQFMDQVYNAGRTGITTNTAFGLNALTGDTNAGQANTAFGYNALASYVSAAPGNGGNTAFGYQALNSMVSGTSNTAIGNGAMSGSGSGILNIAIGSAPMASSTASNCIAIGDGVMTNVSGQYNTSVGSASSATMGAGLRNTAFGYYALNLTNGGSYNTAIGVAALYQNVSGTNNTALGNNAGSAATGDYNLFLGNLAGGYQVAVSNRIFIDTINRGSAAADISDAPIYGITNATVTSQELHFNAGIVETNGRLLQKQGTDVASASTITLTYTGNVFELTGTTAVNLITSTGWQNGSKITLIANENVTINNGAATSGSNITILLAGAANFAMTANDTLTLVLSETTANGVAWREVARSVN